MAYSSNSGASDSSYPREEGMAVWLNEHFQVEEKTLIRDLPWSKVYRVSNNDETAYLKVLPAGEEDVPNKTALINRCFPDVVPRVKAGSDALGLLLLAEHGGIQLGNHPSSIQLRRVLRTYAGMQVSAAAKPPLLEAIPHVDIKSLVDDFLAFLNPKGKRESAAVVGAEFFLGPEKARSYHRALLARADMLKRYLGYAMQLPLTLNHCDLHPRNAAERDDGSIIIYDWDDAVIGPAGLSLHSLFSGSCRVARILDSSRNNREKENRYGALMAYVGFLVDKGYCSRSLLDESIPASAMAGAMRYLMSYSKFPSSKKNYKKEVSRILQRRLSDLLDHCDFISLRHRSDTLRHARFYLDHARSWRAESILEKYCRRHPNDVEMLYRLSTAYRHTENWSSAVKNYKEIILNNPSDATAHNDLGIALVKDGRLEDAVMSFQRALSINPSMTRARMNLQRALEHIEVIEQAKRPLKVPTIHLRDSERAGSVASERLSLGVDLFKEHGVLLVENAFSRKAIAAIRELVMNKYDRYFEEKRHEDALRIGNKRYMVTLDVEGPLNDPAIYACPLVSSLLAVMLGEKHVIGGLNSVVSLPGSKDQGLHKDHPALFPELGRAHTTPPFAIQMLIPLIDLEPSMGVTRVVKGSHRVSSRKAKNMAYQDPVPSLGSCLVTDYRLTHEGLGNTSDTIRPLLCVVFHRPWFHDFVNYEKQAALSISKEELGKVPKKLRHLFRDATIR